MPLYYFYFPHTYRILQVIQSKYSAVNLKHVLNTNLFSFEKAAENDQWFKEEWGESIPETEGMIESVVINTTWSIRLDVIC